MEGKKGERKVLARAKKEVIESECSPEINGIAWIN